MCRFPTFAVQRSLSSFREDIVVPPSIQTRRPPLAGFACLLCLLVSLSAAADEPQAASAATDLVREDWQVMEIDGRRIGYAHTTYRKFRNMPVLTVTQTSEIKFQRFGKDLELKTVLETTESSNGDLRSYSFEIHNPPNQSTRQTGTVIGEYLELELTVNGRPSKRKIPWTPGTKSPLYQERAFEGLAVGERETVKFDLWQPELSKTGTILMRTETVRQTPVFDGTTAGLMKVAIDNSAIPTQRLIAYLDAKGRWYKSETDFFGKTLVTYLVPPEEALKEIAGGELDIALAGIVPMVGLDDPFSKSPVTYRIKLKKDQPAHYFREGAWQKVKKIDANTIDLTVLAPQLPSATTLIRQTDDKYLKSTPFIQADDPLVQNFARSGAANHNDPLRIALSMERYVYDKIETKSFSTSLASAAEVAKSREGDCTEHAMLLAAMLRARRIPSRVCVGLVYSGSISGFVGHMWTEAWIRDRWVPLDATLGKGGISRGHLKLADSSMDESAPAPVTAFLPLMKVLGQMEIEVVRSGKSSNVPVRPPGN